MGRSKKPSSGSSGSSSRSSGGLTSGSRSSGGFRSGGSSSSRGTASRSPGTSSRSSSSRSPVTTSSGSSRNSSSGFGTSFSRGMGYSMGRQMGNRMMGGGRGRGRSAGGFGCSSIFMILIPILIIVVALILFSDTSGVDRSTINRTAITNVADGDVLIYRDSTDTGDWFTNDASMLSGANDAFKLTGVKFGVFVFDNMTAGDAELREVGKMLYDEFFGQSTGHLLILLIDEGNGNYILWYEAGSAASTVFDAEAMKIFNGYIGKYWDAPDRYTESEMFGLALKNTAERIMSITPTFGSRIAPFIGVAVVIFVLLFGVTIALKASAKRKEAAAQEAEANAALLNSDLKTFGESGNDAASDLAKLYQDE